MIKAYKLIIFCVGCTLLSPLAAQASMAPSGSGYYVSANKSLVASMPALVHGKNRKKPRADVLSRLLFSWPAKTHGVTPTAPSAVSLAGVAQPSSASQAVQLPPDSATANGPLSPSGSASPQNSAPANKPTENPADAAKQVEVAPANSTVSPARAEDASVTVLPTKPSFDYGTYHQWMSQLDDLRQILGEELALAKDLSSVDKATLQDAQEQLSHARVTQTNLEQALLSAGTEGAQDLAGLTAQFQKDKSQLLQAALKVMPSQAVETRAIWLDRGSIIESGSPEGLRRLMGKLSRAGLNTVFFEALNAGYPLFNSPYLPNNPLLPKLPNGQTWDPLAVAVEEGHRLGMEVHAWVWCFAVGNIRHNQIIGLPNQYPGPILTTRPADALRGVGGNLIPRQGKQTEFWLSPGTPSARDFLKNVMGDLVKNYAVDGVQLDYIRYPFQTAYTPGGRGLMGFEPVARQRFELETGLSLNNLDDNTLRSFTAWKTNQVSQFVKDVSLSLKALRPGLKLSAAVYPMRRDERILAIQQDWETWLANGWIDILCPMTYSRSVDGYNQALKDIDAPVFNLGKTLTDTENPLTRLPSGQAFIYPGVALHRLDDATATGILRSSHKHGLLGNTLFAMVYLDEQRQKTLQLGPYKQQPATPAHHDSLNGLLNSIKTFQHQCVLLSRRPGASPTETVSAWPPLLDALNNWQKGVESLKQLSANDTAGITAALITVSNQERQVQQALSPLISPPDPKLPVTTPVISLPPLPRYITCFLKGNAQRLDRLFLLVSRGLAPSSIPNAPASAPSTPVAGR